MEAIGASGEGALSGPASRLVIVSVRLCGRISHGPPLLQPGWSLAVALLSSPRGSGLGGNGTPPGPIRDIGTWRAAAPGATSTPPGPIPPGVKPGTGKPGAIRIPPGPGVIGICATAGAPIAMNNVNVPVASRRMVCSSLLQSTRRL